MIFDLYGTTLFNIYETLLVKTLEYVKKSYKTLYL
jgi:hypothetical protein